MDSRNIGDNIIENVETGETTKLSSLWSESACVIQFLRRFGCPVCRMGSRDLTHLKPRLDAANVRMVAIGMEETGAKEFLESGFWKGELYIDRQKKIYGVLNFERYTFMTIIACLFTKRSREAISKAKSQGISGNMSGDTLQMGGTLVIDKGGKVLLEFKQETPTDSVPLDRILRVLGIGRQGRTFSMESHTSIDTSHCDEC
ncbi:prostamide/prostaglandin F synthase-like [Lytechinus pictus]|uniref:prostamide/prostaglandin F synthase-like n=1 Tax=Lytechinus pictus TaxID=7653 RepID=UPI00240D2493|nr:prostamide/prostaglandin F synthase-like [Lytechinus pictus]